MATDPSRLAEARMDASSLYREEIVTDRKVGTLRILVPISDDGQPNIARPTIYQGEAQLMTSMGPLPISFEIEAKSLAEAVAGYGAAAKAALDRTMKELADMRRQQQTGLVIPQAGGGMGGLGGMPGGLPGGGKIQMP